MIPEKQRKKTDSVTGIDFQSSDGEMIIDLTQDQQTVNAGISKNQAIDLKNILGYLN